MDACAHALSWRQAGLDSRLPGFACTCAWNAFLINDALRPSSVGVVIPGVWVRVGVRVRVSVRVRVRVRVRKVRVEVRVRVSARPSMCIT